MMKNDEVCEYHTLFIMLFEQSAKKKLVLLFRHGFSANIHISAEMVMHGRIQQIILLSTKPSSVCYGEIKNIASVCLGCVCTV